MSQPPSILARVLGCIWFVLAFGIGIYVVLLCIAKVISWFV